MARGVLDSEQKVLKPRKGKSTISQGGSLGNIKKKKNYGERRTISLQRPVLCSTRGN